MIEQMTMKKNMFYVLVSAALTTMSCTNDIPSVNSDEISGNQVSKPGVITILANVASESRVPQLNADGSGKFVKGDVMTLCVAKEGTRIVKDYAYDTDFLKWSDLNLSNDISQVTFSACYPQQKLAQDGTFEFNSQEALYKDLLLSPAQTVDVGTSQPISLTFNHVLHRLDLTFTPGYGYSEDDFSLFSLSLQGKTTCLIDAVNGCIKEVKNEIGKYTSTERNSSFYLVPQATEGISLQITVAGETKQLSLDALFKQFGKPQTELQGGKRCTLTLKVGRDGITVTGGSIGAWENQATADGEVVIG